MQYWFTTRRIGRAVLTFCGSESPRPCVVLLATDESGRVWGRAVALEGLTFRGVKAYLARSKPSEVARKLADKVWGQIDNVRNVIRELGESFEDLIKVKEHLHKIGFDYIRRMNEREMSQICEERNKLVGNIGEEYVAKLFGNKKVSASGPDLVLDDSIYEIKSIDLLTCKDEETLRERIEERIRNALKEYNTWVAKGTYVSKFWNKCRPKRIVIAIIGVIIDDKHGVVAARLLGEVEVSVVWALGGP